MWLEITYKPTTLFSLKISSATNSAGKSLPCPSPYSVKMALLNAIITYDSLEVAKSNFNLIRNLEMRFYMPNSFVTNNCMLKIFKLKRNEFSTKEKKELRENGLSNDEIKEMEYVKKISDPFQPVVAFREYVFLPNKIRIAVKLRNEEDLFNYVQIEFLKKWFMHINYFGKKGCFFQFISAKVVPELQEGYSHILDESLSAGIMFPMDDVVKDNSILFKNMDNYDTAKAKREQQIHILPFRQVAANKNFTYFQRNEY